MIQCFWGRSEGVFSDTFELGTFTSPFNHDNYQGTGFGGYAFTAIDLGAETLELLKSHKAQQAAVKMRHRHDYHDHGLVFAKNGRNWVGNTTSWAIRCR